MICKRASWQRRKFTPNPSVCVCVWERDSMCVSLCWCAYQTQDTMPAKNCWPNNKWMGIQKRKVRERGRQSGRVRGVACSGALQNNLNCHCKVGSAQRFACWGGIKKVCLVPVRSSSNTRSNYASCLLLFSQAINFCPDFTCPAPELPTHRHT